MKTKTLLTALATTAAFAVGSANAAEILINDYSLAPNGLNETTTFQNTDIANLLNPAANGTVFYVVSTFNFGTASDAHLQWQFSTVDTSANRLGVEVQDTGLVQILGSGTGGILQNISPTTSKRSSVNLATDMAGTTITLIAKFYYNTAVSSDLGARTAALPGGSETTADDTIMNVWINPDNLDVEGDISTHAAMIGNGDMYAVWNSTSFNHFRQVIQNQLTPNTSGTSSITDTVILTGDDATFANALLAAGVPEPGSLALLGLGGLLVASRRRRG